MKTQYTLLSGETLEFTAPTGDLDGFLRRIIAGSTDPALQDRELCELVHGPTNPLLDHTVVPGKPIATAEVYRDPVFHVMLDCIARKRIDGGTNVTSARARYTMTVPDAARQLGISESAVRQAIYGSRLRAHKDGGTYYLDPKSVAGYRVSRRGPRRNDDTSKGPPGNSLEAKLGITPEASLKVKHALHQLVLEDQDDGQWSGSLADGWHRIGLLGVSQDRARFWEIEPAEGESVLYFEGFYVRGGFRVLDTVSNTSRAKAMFKSYTAK